MTRSASHRPRPLSVLCLEDRSVPSVAPLDPAEAITHTPSADVQQLNWGMDGLSGQHTVAADSNGNYVVTWESAPAAGGDADVYARRFAADGTPRGPEFRVNTTTAGNQRVASVAADAAGDFVVLWQDGDFSISGHSKIATRARVYNADGTARTGELTVATGSAQPEDVGMDATGNFVVAYHVNLTTSIKFYAQRYSATGAAQGKTITLGSTDAYNQEATVGVDGAGNFVVGWKGSATVRRFDRLGNLLGTIPVMPSAIDMNAGGEFVVLTGSGSDAEARVYRADGTLKLSIPLPNATESGNGEVQAVALSDAGEVSLGYVNWVRRYDPVTGAYTGSDYDAGVRAYDPAGALLGSSSAATVTTGDQTTPGLAALGSGTFVAVWDGNGPGDGQGVFARRFQAAADVPASPLMAAGGPAAGPAARLTDAELAPIVREAVRRWNTTVLTAAERALLRTVTVHVGDLDGATLGLTGGTTVTIDRDAAGYGWFVDPTPRSDTEFHRTGDQGERGRVDLLTAVEHELGHVLGREHAGGGVMGETLSTGTREHVGPGTRVGHHPPADAARGRHWFLASGRRP